MKPENEPLKPSAPPSLKKPESAMTDEEWSTACRGALAHLEAEKAFAPNRPPQTEDEIKLSKMA